MLLNSMQTFYQIVVAKLLSHDFREHSKKVFSTDIQGMRIIMDTMGFSNSTLENQGNERLVEIIPMQSAKHDSN